MKHLLLALLLLPLAACNYNRFGAMDKVGHTPLFEPNSSIAKLKLGEVRSSTIVRGVVLTSDSTGNFYKEFLVADPVQGGETLRLKAGLYDIYTMYGVGREVLVELVGSEIVLEDGVLTARLASNFSALALCVQLTGSALELKPRRASVSQVANLPAGSFVELEGVYFKDAGFRSFAGVSVLQEFNGGESVNVYTSPYALFADDALPLGVLTVRCILFFVDGRPQLKLLL